MEDDTELLQELHVQLCTHWICTSYEGNNVANQSSRKEVVFDWRLEESHSYFVVILINIRE